MNNSTLQLEGATLVVQTRYNAGLVTAIKSLPGSERKYDPSRRAWLVDPRHGQQVANWIQQYLGYSVAVPQATHINASPQLHAFTVKYIGAVKDRGDGEKTAFGNDGNEWRYIFPENVLRQWFEGIEINIPTAKSSLYGVLGIKRGVNEADIKAAYRRLVKQWHPDVCREADAPNVFMRIQEAYQILIDPSTRARYDAGLKLEDSVGVSVYGTEPTYRAPLRCGYLQAEGHEIIGRFVVDKILAWEDIIENGKTLVVSWPMGADRWEEQWI